MHTPQPLVVDDVVKGAEIWVRFDMKNAKDGSPAPSKMYLGWVTRITAADVVWIRFGRCNGSTYTFNLDEMLENQQDFVRHGPPVEHGEEEEEDEDEDEDEEEECVHTLMMFCIEI